MFYRKLLLLLTLGIGLLMVAVATAALGAMADGMPVVQPRVDDSTTEVIANDNITSTIYLPIVQRPPDNIHTVCKAGPPHCEYSVIQEAVDAIGDGGIIKVAAGVYTDVQGRAAPVGYPGPGVISQVVYVDKDITIRGGYTITNDFADPPNPDENPTTLDALGLGRGISVWGTITSTIEGIRITGGDARGLGGSLEGEDSGGGVYINNATALLKSNTIMNSRALQLACDVYHICWETGYGGGLYVSNSTVNLIKNTVASDRAGRDGGGLYLNQSSATLTGNVVEHCTSTYGGGLYIGYGNTTLTGNTVRENAAGGVLHAGARCGGLLIDGGTAWLVDNSVASNWGDFEADGICLHSSNATLRGNVISSQHVGLEMHDSEAVLINNVVADSQGYGLYISGSSVSLLQNTVTCANCLTDYGTGIYVTDHGVASGSTVEMVNTILVSYAVGISVTTGSNATLEATLWGSGSWENGIDWGGVGTISTGTINIWGDPDFADPSAGDYHIGPGSAAVDAGVDAGVDDDMDGQPRPMGDGFDIGADELLE